MSTRFWVMFLTLFACVGISLILLVGCGNRNLIDTTYRYEYAYIRLPNGETVEGKVQSWDDYEDSDMLQVEIDGKVYLTYSSNVVLVSE